jgi:hypothetical protein
MGVDITITATSRPEILRRTLQSFNTNMFRFHSSLIRNVFINVDPVGTADPKETIRVCSEVFDPKIVTAHVPSTPSFPKAFIWTWQQTLSTDSACVFHLEDDWELLRPVDMQQLFLLLYLYPDLTSLKLSAFASATHVLKCWDKFCTWNGTFFEVPPNLRGLLGFCGHPTLLRKEFVRAVLPYLDDTKNPEKQIKGSHPQFGQYILSHRFGWYHGQDEPAAVKDIGRQWMIDNGFRKSGSKAWFTEWEDSEGKKPKLVESDADKKPSTGLKLVK